MSTSSLLPPHWSEVIERIHGAIRTALDAAQVQEQRLAVPQPSVEADSTADEALSRLQQRLAAMQTCCERAARTQAEAEAALTDAADRLVAFRTEVSPPRGTMATPVDRAVS